MKTISLARVHEVFHYDPNTGIFTNRINRRRSGKAGDIAGSMTKGGYIELGLDGMKFYAHRLAWFYMTGEWPEQVDHWDKNRSNNVFTNLRGCNNAQNQANRKTMARCGYKGVTRHNCGKWMAQIMVKKKHIYLGLFDAAIDAHRAYCISALAHFGEFANFGENSPFYAQRTLT